MDSVSTRLARRIDRFIDSRPLATRLMAAACRGYSRHRDPRCDTERYWLLLPQWVGGLRRVGPRTVDDILWAQYCLFAFVSMQDEVLDAQSSSSGELFAAYEFLAEAERVFARAVRDPRFWRYYRQSLERTARGILAARTIQRAGPGPIEPLLSSYAAQSSILKIGCAAVCIPGGARGLFHPCSRFADHLAIAGQLLDDLEDLGEDLANGRLNAVARLLVPEAGPDTPDIHRRIAAAFVLERTAGAILQRIRGHAREAASAIAPLALKQARRYLDALQADLDRVEASIHRARVAAVFEPLLAVR